MNRLATKGRTLFALGLGNVVRIGAYRLGLRLGLNSAQKRLSTACVAPFFTDPEGPPPQGVRAPAAWHDDALLFGHWPLALSEQPPDWLANPLTGQRVPEPHRGWWQIPDFDPAVGDIKPIWELSRMDWALAFAQQARCAHPTALGRLNAWIADWCAVNPPYSGPNWKCGQEASIRLMHLAMAAHVLGQVRTAAAGLIQLIDLHLQRIAPTVSYAMAQDNNHGTSEAAALFIGGSWLATLGNIQARSYARAGRRLLENRVARLIGEQGTFSQYSLNYHRVMLDTLCMAETWRRALALEPFSALWQARALAATQWLRQMVDPHTGEGPNVGANDGAHLLQLSGTPYRDYRPTVQLAMALFASECAYPGAGAEEQPVRWLGLPAQRPQAAALASLQADDGGFAVLRRGAAVAIMRYPRFRFRPSQADAMHIELMSHGVSLLRDAGSYSYNTEARWLDYFAGTAGHNTIQFDDRDQMPRIGRFLFGDWLHTESIEPLAEAGDRTCFGASYIDAAGARHERRVALSERRLSVEDKIGGFAQRAVLRWRLRPGTWTVGTQAKTVTITDDARTVVLTLRSTVPVTRCEIVQGWESRHYLEKTPLPVVEFTVAQPGMLTSEITWPT